jgi:ABC-2 type transport system permease protein
MSTQSNAMSEFGGQQITPTVLSATRPFYWSVRRELWEYRSIYLAPLAIAGAVLLGFLVVLVHLPQTFRDAMALDPTHQRDALAQPFEVAAGLIMAAAFIVSIYYSLDTLYGERRDRSILFWKSLPVSDLTAVLAKAGVLFLFLPVLAFVITLIAETILLVLSCAVLAASGLSIATFWSQLMPVQTMTGLLYHLVTVHILWYAPLYTWLMLISAWSRRAPLLWAALPPFAIVVFERIAFHTSHFAAFLNSRVSGGSEAESSNMLDPAMKFTPGHFMATPGLWFGLLFAAIFLVAAARLRRYRGPI